MKKEFLFIRELPALLQLVDWFLEWETGRMWMELATGFDEGSVAVPSKYKEKIRRSKKDFYGYGSPRKLTPHGFVLYKCGVPFISDYGVWKLDWELLSKPSYEFQLDSMRIVDRVFDYAALIAVNSGYHESWQNGRFNETYMNRAFGRVGKAMMNKMGLKKLLEQEKIKGVGKALSARIVDHFGTETLDVIKMHPARLSEVKGISVPKARAIYNHFVRKTADQEKEQEMLINLMGMGFSAKNCKSLIKHFGDEAHMKMIENLYLCADVKGIGFKTVDRIALGGHNKYGIHDHRRLKAALKQAMVDVSMNGSVEVHKSEWYKHTRKFIAVKSEILDMITEELIEEGEIVRGSSDTKELYGHHIIVGYEKSLAEAIKLRHMSRLDMSALIDVDKHISECEKENKFDLSPDQKGAVKDVLSGKASIFLLTGGPGTGKTTLLNVIVSAAKKAGQSVKLMSPTGRASRRMQETTGHHASTVHIAMGYDPITGSWSHGLLRPIPEGVIIIDEASMLDTHLAMRIFQGVRPESIVIVVGDTDQLPSVGAGAVLRDLSHIAAVDGLDYVKHLKLTEIHRQAMSSAIVRASHRIRSGKLPEPFKPNDDFCLIFAQDKFQIERMIVKMVTDRLPAMGFDPYNDVQILSPMRKSSVTGTAYLNAKLQDLINGIEHYKPEIRRRSSVFGRETAWIKYRVGDRVMETRNNYDSNVFNGEIGTILEVDMNNDVVTVEYRDPTRIVDYRRYELNRLEHAYAITIHKSQGSEYPCVINVVSSAHYHMLNRNIIYTGVTRGRKFSILLAEERALRDAIGKEQSDNRTTGLFRRVFSDVYESTKE